MEQILLELPITLSTRHSYEPLLSISHGYAGGRIALAGDHNKETLVSSSGWDNRSGFIASPHKGRTGRHDEAQPGQSPEGTGSNERTQAQHDLHGTRGCWIGCDAPVVRRSSERADRLTPKGTRRSSVSAMARLRLPDQVHFAPQGRSVPAPPPTICHLSKTDSVQLARWKR